MPATVNAKYNRYSDNLAPLAAAVSVDGGTIEAGYDIERIRDGSAARPLRLSTKQGMVKYHFASAVEVAIVAIAHANYVAGLTIHVEGNDTDVWTSPSFAQTLAAPVWRADRFPGEPWLDTRALSGFGSYHYWRVGTKDDNTVNVSIGEIWLGSTVRELSPNYVWGGAVGFDQPQIEHATAYRRLRTPLGTTRRAISADLNPATNAGAQDVIDWFLDANGRSTLLIPDGTIADGAWLALNTVSVQQITQQFLDYNRIHLSFEEDGRGLEPTPSPLP
jgi:hypothetical protein